MFLSLWILVSSKLTSLHQSPICVCLEDSFQLVKKISEWECIPVGCTPPVSVSVLGRGVSAWGDFSLGVSAQEVGCLLRGVYLPGGDVCPGGCLPKGWDVCLGWCLTTGCLPRGMSAQGGVCLGGSLPGGSLPGGCLPRGVHLLWTEWQTGVKVITLSQTSFAGGNQSTVSRFTSVSVRPPFRTSNWKNVLVQGKHYWHSNNNFSPA